MDPPPKFVNKLLRASEKMEGGGRGFGVWDDLVRGCGVRGWGLGVYGLRARVWGLGGQISSGIVDAMLGAQPQGRDGKEVFSLRKVHANHRTGCSVPALLLSSAPLEQSRPPCRLQLMPYWEHIPTSVRGEEVYKSFVYGFAQVILNPKP